MGDKCTCTTEPERYCRVHRDRGIAARFRELTDTLESELAGALLSLTAEENRVKALEPTARKIRAIEKLIQSEGDSVTLVCDNPEFDGPNSVIVVNGDWTNWEDLRFHGDTMLDCLENAVTEREHGDQPITLCHEHGWYERGPCQFCEDEDERTGR